MPVLAHTKSMILRDNHIVIQLTITIAFPSVARISDVKSIYPINGPK